MAKVILVTGGARSGKSSYAQKEVELRTENPHYIATAHIWDEDFKARVERHKQERGSQWVNHEEEISISSVDTCGEVVLLDCITLWLTNIFYKNNSAIDESLAIAQQEWLKFIDREGVIYVVSNEIGMGVHPEHELARKFADLQGWMNQFIAKNAQEVILMVSGCALKIK